MNWRIHHITFIKQLITASGWRHCSSTLAKHLTTSNIYYCWIKRQQSVSSLSWADGCTRFCSCVSSESSLVMWWPAEQLWRVDVLRSVVQTVRPHLRPPNTANDFQLYDDVTIIEILEQAVKSHRQTAADSIVKWSANNNMKINNSKQRKCWSTSRNDQPFIPHRQLQHWTRIVFQTAT